MAQRFDDEERRRIAAERLKTSLTTDATTPYRRHWRDRWSEGWMNGCFSVFYFGGICLGVVWVIAAIYGLVSLTAGFVTVFGIGAVVSVALFVARILVANALRRGRGR